MHDDERQDAEEIGPVGPSQEELFLAGTTGKSQHIFDGEKYKTYGVNNRHRTSISIFEIAFSDEAVSFELGKRLEQNKF